MRSAKRGCAAAAEAMVDEEGEALGCHPC
jgi:hypothetical protein